MAQRKGEGKATEGKRQGHRGPIPNSLRTQTAPRKESDLWAWILGPQRSRGPRTGKARRKFGQSPACGVTCLCCLLSWPFPLSLESGASAWICIIRYHQLRDWGVRKWFNRLILWTGLLCALGTSVVGNFQQKNQLHMHLVGAFFALFLGNSYFWLQLILVWYMRRLPQPGPPWMGPLRLGLCSLCTILLVTMMILHFWPLRSASAACEWAIAMLLFALFGLFAVDFSCLDGCTLHLQPGHLSSPPASPTSLQIHL
ncbi:modulator of macroautophagy TMEM150B isoform X1 [Mustela erminea]|uniref:modulator of macroautophagy TMEM150B isoform X1 n=1 Tax=Mustela erminea TaxID=36723 RepID=UPI0013871669|nr:modulator of macroautophagy TMEM150B isoform X1 [Mustela erminea]XP_032182458.1 modulator of macroautophagy TMEM150B isoform X1 [Mustela erminea]